MQTIALIEDDPDLRELLSHKLRKEGYRFAASGTGAGAIDFLDRVRPDLLLLDVMLPYMPGFDICKAIRADDNLRRLPIIFLTARASEEDRVRGLELGANDYLVKPFFMRELVARVKLQLETGADPSEPLSAPGLAVDRRRFEVRADGKLIELTATEFKLLAHLMECQGRVRSRPQLIDAVWGRDRYVSERAVDVCVLRLRQKLGDTHESPRWIRSVRGFGYTFDPAH